MKPIHPIGESPAAKDERVEAREGIVMRQLNVKDHIFTGDYKLVPQRLVKYMIDQQWQEKCDIIVDYMPPYPRPDTRPIIVVRYNDGSEHPPFLRFSAGPKQGFFWDIYGEDFQTVELAILALSQAPTPYYVGPITFRIPLPPREEKS